MMEKDIKSLQKRVNTLYILLIILSLVCMVSVGLQFIKSQNDSALHDTQYQIISGNSYITFALANYLGLDEEHGCTVEVSEDYSTAYYVCSNEN